ncbi:hypothetical protein EJ110_NYTH42156 [Nymphaea thermarum]|nr:hypothetical protein EJ110_NYTH42156 [Nymphaea thermarum]
MVNPRQQIDQIALLTSYWGDFKSIVMTHHRNHASPIGDTTAPLKEQTTSVLFKQFMSVQPFVCIGDGNPDATEEWIEEVKCIFELLKMAEGDKVNYSSYLLKGDAKGNRPMRFYRSTTTDLMEIVHRFILQHLLPNMCKNKKMQEFLKLQQNHMSLEEYVIKCRHVEMYCLHLYTTDEARVDKFVLGLRANYKTK